MPICKTISKNKLSRDSMGVLGLNKCISILALYSQDESDIQRKGLGINRHCTSNCFSFQLLTCIGFEELHKVLGISLSSAAKMCIQYGFIPN